MRRYNRNALFGKGKVPKSRSNLELILINNHSIVVQKEVYDEIQKLREAIRMAKRFLDVPV